MPTAAARIEEIVAMSCLPEDDAEPHVSWTLWLDFWALAARNPEVAELRQEDDERWRELIARWCLRPGGGRVPRRGPG